MISIESKYSYKSPNSSTVSSAGDFNTELVFSFLKLVAFLITKNTLKNLKTPLMTVETLLYD